MSPRACAASSSRCAHRPRFLAILRTRTLCGPRNPSAIARRSHVSSPDESSVTMISHGAICANAERTASSDRRGHAVGDDQQRDDGSARCRVDRAPFRSGSRDSSSHSLMNFWRT